MLKPTKRTVSAANLISKLEVNVREANNYDLPAMCEQIVQAGRILKPIMAEDTPDGLVVLSGNRRTRAAQELLADHTKVSAIWLQIAENERDSQKREAMRKAVVSTTDAVIDALSKVDVIVYKDLTEEERLMLIMDHGSEKPISRTEVVNCVWRMDRQFFSEADIIKLTYFAMAKYTGNERKLSEVPVEPKAREAFLRKWLHGSVGNYILKAHKMGPYIREQFILTHRAEDGLLGPDEKVELRCSRDRIQQLSSAKEGEKDVWTPEGGSPEFNKLIEKFRAEDSGEIEKETKKRPTVKELTDKADVFQCGAVRKALLIAAGETGDKVAGLMEDDARIARLEAVEKILTARWDNLPEPAKTLVKHILGGSPKQLDEFLANLK